MREGPFRTLSRRLPDAPEKTDAFRAMFDNKVIPNTWGNLASQLVEGGHVGTSIEEICTFLGITREEFRDPTLRFTSAEEIESFEINILDRWATEYRKEHDDDDIGYLNHIGGFTDEFLVIDGEEKAKAIEANIRMLGAHYTHEMSVAKNNIKADPNKRLGFSQQQKYYEAAIAIDNERALHMLKRKAVLSGTAIPLDRFAEHSLCYEGEYSPAPERIALALRSVIRSLINEYPVHDARPNEVVIGEEQISEFCSVLADQRKTMARMHAKAKWAAISNLFYAGDYDDHPLFNSTNDHEQ